MPIISACLTACTGGFDSGDADPVLSDADDATVVESAEGADLDVLDTAPAEQEGNSAELEGDAQGTPDVDDQRIGLIANVTPRCAVVDETLDVVITRTLAEGEEPPEDDESLNVTGFVSFTQSFGSSLNLIARADESAVFSFTQQDVVGLTANIENGSVTTFLAAYDASAPEDFIMRKPFTNGCLYAFKSGSSCAATLTRANPISLTLEGMSISVLGCELQNPDNIPVIELPAVDE